MAKTIRDEDLRLNIIINGDNGRKQMGELERSIHDTNTKLETLYQKRQKLEAQGKQDTQAYRNLSAQIGRHTKAIDGYREKLAALRRQQSVNTMTLSELTSHISLVRAQLNKTDPKTPLWRQLNAELKTSSARLAELRAQAKVTGGTICTMAERANRYIGLITAGFASLTAVFSGVSRAKRSFQEWDEAIANAMKTTQLSREEMLQLNEALKKMDTRTSQNSLLGLARTAGKLGIEGQDNILQFVSAADKINIALSEDLGDNAEDALREIGKLVDIFSLETEFGLEQAMLKTGSAINSLGMASTANEGYIVEFTKRVAGIAPNADISIDKILGLAATLDKYGQMSETSATAIGQTIMGMFRRTDEFARVAGMSVAEFKDLLVNDANEALLTVLEGMNRGGDGMITVVKALDSLHLQGQRASTVLGSLAKHSDELRHQQSLANQAFTEGTSIIEEANIKNTTATAIMEKRKKAIVDEAVALGQTLTPAINVSLSAGTWLLKGLSALVTVGVKYRAIIVGLAATYAAYVLQQKLVVTWTKLQVFWSKANQMALMREALSLNGARTSTMLLCAAKALLAGNLKAASIAFKGFWASMGPIGWATLMIGGIITAINAWRVASERNTASTRAMQRINEKVTESLDKERSKIDVLTNIIHNNTLSINARRQAISDLQQIIPKYKADLTKEGELIGENTQAINDYIVALERKIRLAAAQEELAAAYRNKRQIEKQKKDAEEELKQAETYNSLVATPRLNNGQLSTPGLRTIASASVKKPTANIKLRIEAADAALAEENALIKSLEKEVASGIESNLSVKVKPSSGDVDGGGGGDYGQKWSLNSDESFLQKRLALKKEYQTSETMTEEEYNAKLLQLEIDALTARLKTNADSGADRVALEEDLADRLIQQKEQMNKGVEQAEKEIERLEEEWTKSIEDEARKREKIEMDIAEMSGDRIAIEKAKYEKLKREYAGNARALEALERAHKARLAKIQLEEADKEVETRQNAYKIARMQMVERQRQEMDTFSGSERERREKRKKHWAELNALDEKYLNEMIATLSTLVSDAKIGDIEIGVTLSDDDKTKLLEQIADLRQQLNKLKDTSEGTQNDKNFFAEFLGISGERWDEILKDGFNTEDIITMTEALADSVMSIWGKVNDFMAKSEEAELKKYKKSNDEKKKTLEKRLDAGLITEAQYNAEVEAMDAEYEAYQEELALKQAKRQKAMSITESVINTALGVTKSLTGMPWPINLIAAAATLAMGVAQTALIAATPITTGAEDGGPIGNGTIDVRREQDGKPFRARLNPNKRGFVSSPTVLVAENGTEYVLPNEVVQNPTAYPLLSAVETARQHGTLSSLDFSAIYSPYSVAGRAAGGYIGDTPRTTMSSSQTTDDSGEVKALLLRVLTVLSKPLDARVVMLGRNGIVENLEKYNKQKSRGKIGG